MGSLTPMPEDEGEDNRQRHEVYQAQEESGNYEPPYDYQSYGYEPVAQPTEEELREQAMADGISRMVGLVRSYLRAGPNSYGLLPRNSLLNIIKMHFEGHSGDLEASLVRAITDFDHYHYLNQVPLLNSDEASVPVSIRTVKRRLEAAGIAERDEAYKDPGVLQAAINKWNELDLTHAVGTIEEASETLHDNLEAFMTKRYGGLRMWKNEVVPERIPERSVMTDGDFDSPVGANVGTGLFSVTVNSKTPGYRILVSPAYFIDWVYFGAPSTPVTREMLPGRYIFGTDSIDGSVVSDGVIFRIPTDFTPHLGRF